MIRLAKIEDLPIIIDVFKKAKAIMRQDGNMNQWSGSYPDKDVLLEDIAKRQLYVIEEEEIEACFVLQIGDDPTYGYIEGKWISDEPYVTIHRIAKAKGRHIFAKMLEYVTQRYDHIRIDTHKDNKIMQYLLKTHGFNQRGIIYLLDGDPRLAYEYLR